MKLLTKTTLYFLLAMIPLLTVAGYLMFAQFNRQINERADKELLYEELQWVSYLRTTTGRGSRFILQTPELLIYPSNRYSEEQPRLSTVYSKKAGANVQIPFRQLADVVNINGFPYQIIILKSQEQKLALITNIIIMMLLVFAGLLIATVLFNWAISNRLWKPFRRSLQKIRNIELPQLSSVRFEQTNTQEFNELNTSLNAMVNKIQGDYLNMKEFTENAAHEMQTPLAVAQTKLELLLQDPGILASQMEAISQAATSLQRLSKLNQSLLVLAKIENQQYEPATAIDLTDVTKKYLHLFSEIITDKQIVVDTEFTGSFEVKLHPFLADSLISNLLGNAIKYNHTGGKIKVAVNSMQYFIENTSHEPAIDARQLFKRFSNSNNNGRSTGLGLAIVKKIADTHQLSISYRHISSMHQFILSKRTVNVLSVDASNSWSSG